MAGPAASGANLSDEGALRPVLVEPSHSPAPPGFDSLQLSGEKCLLVASTGGHLRQLAMIADSAGVSGDSLWLADRSPQSESLLTGRRVEWIPYVGPRDGTHLWRLARLARAVIARDGLAAAISTGAAPAVPVLAAALAMRKRGIYIESVSRVVGPSLTGRILRCVPGAERYGQYPGWSQHRGWSYTGSVFDCLGDVVSGADAAPNAAPLNSARPRVLVTLGTIRPYRFDRLIDRLLELLPADAECVWQLGATTRSDLPGRAYAYMPADELRATMSASDVVVSHAGVGSALDLLDAGSRFVLVPRRMEFGEHIDDHQAQIANEFGRRRLGLAAEASDLTAELLFPSAMPDP